MTERLEATVLGRVQGVGFRWWVRRLALRGGLTGWVRNEPDGSVRVVAEGPSQALESLLEALRGGPDGAEVDRVEAVRSSGTGAFGAFEIRSGGHAGD